MSRVLGIDIGGTQSSAQLCVGGAVVAEGQTGSASLVAVGPDAAAAALASLLRQLRLDPEVRLDAVCVGSAGASIPATRDFLAAHLAPLASPGKLLVVRDGELVLPAAGLTEGIAVVAGTGSMALGCYQGDQVQIGGWGYLLGDEGSGYWIVRAAVRALLDRRDRRLPTGQLGERLMAAAGVNDVADLHRLFYEQPQPAVWARHAPLVLDDAGEVADRIATEAAMALGRLPGSVAERLAAPPDLPVVLAGGLFRYQLLASTVRLEIGADLPGSIVRVLAEPPVTGAVRLAQALAEPAGTRDAR